MGKRSIVIISILAVSAVCLAISLELELIVASVCLCCICVFLLGMLVQQAWDMRHVAALKSQNERLAERNALLRADLSHAESELTKLRSEQFLKEISR